MKEIIELFRKWKAENSDLDESYFYDEIHEFIHQFDRGELLSFFEEVDELLSKNSEIK